MGTLSFQLGPLAAGTSASVSATLKGTVPGNVTNVVSATSIEGGSNSASAAIVVFQPAAPPVDLTVICAVNDTYVPVGSNLVYTIVVSNNSSTVATGVLLTNKLPASATFVSAIASSGTVTQSNGVVTVNLGSVANNSAVTIVIRAMPSQPDVLINRTSVTSVEPDGNPGDNVAYTLALSEVLITSVQELGADVVVSFESSLGRNYFIESRTDLNPGAWVMVPGTAVTGTGHILPVTILGAFTQQPQQFYRVVLTP